LFSDLKKNGCKILKHYTLQYIYSPIKKITLEYIIVQISYLILNEIITINLTLGVDCHTF